MLVTPYLLVGATNSRYFRGFSEAVLNFTPLQDVKGFHGIDERIGVGDLHRMIHFYELPMRGSECRCIHEEAGTHGIPASIYLAMRVRTPPCAGAWGV